MFHILLKNVRHTVNFEFDEEKNRINFQKHGIRLEDSCEIWNDLDMIIGPATSVKEDRWAAVGKIKNHHWLVVFTYRQNAIRLITCRRARREEIETYEASK